MRKLDRLALEILKLNVKVTPKQLNDHLGNEVDYASKRIWSLKKAGFVFDTEKEGRVVVSYTLVSEPANKAELMAEKVKAPKKVKEPKAKVPAKKKIPENKAPSKVKEKNLKTMKKVLKKIKKDKQEVEEILKEEPSATSYAVDADWDNGEVSDLVDITKDLSF